MKTCLVGIALASALMAQTDDDKAAQARENKAVDQLEKVDNFCYSIYHQTIDKKKTELTVKESKAIPACEGIGRYREQLLFDELIEEHEHFIERFESGESDRQDELRKYLLTLIPAPTKTKPKAKH